MLNRKTGLVSSIDKASDDLWVLGVQVDNKLDQAYLFPALAGKVEIGDKVMLNTTAVDLQLGSGGYHYVMANLSGNGKTPSCSSRQKGHIMKMRYTPLQIKVLAVEEQDSPYHDRMARATGLKGLPVIGGSLHSMLAPCICGIKAENPDLRIAYVMTDGGALPLALSSSVRSLREQGLLCGTVTYGHAFGGDLEAVTLYSALCAAREVLEAQLIVVMMGPGVVGTGTSWGHSGLEVGTVINAVSSLGGLSFTIPRLSFGDLRKRHRGISHHTLTALERVAMRPTSLVLPEMEEYHKETILGQLESIRGKHRLLWGRGGEGVALAQKRGLSLRHMGRSYEEDPLFFLAAAATGQMAARAATAAVSC